MAIEIIPKKIKQGFQVKEILFYVTLLIFIGVLIGYFVLISSTRKAEAEKQRLEDEIAKIKVSDTEKELLGIQKKIQNIDPLLQNHVFSSKTFSFLEGKTHPKVFFTQFSLDSKIPKLVVSGQTDSFLELGQQILILAGDSFIQTLGLSRIEISKDGKVEFSLDIYLNPKIFRF